jgi:hypothetical protein
MHQKYKEQLENEQKILEQNHIELKVLEKKNEALLETASTATDKVRLSKKRRMKMDKIRRDTSLDPT